MVGEEQLMKAGKLKHIDSEVLLAVLGRCVQQPKRFHTSSTVTGRPLFHAGDGNGTALEFNRNLFRMKCYEKIRALGNPLDKWLQFHMLGVLLKKGE